MKKLFFELLEYFVFIAVFYYITQMPMWAAVGFALVLGRLNQIKHV